MLFFALIGSYNSIEEIIELEETRNSEIHKPKYCEIWMCQLPSQQGSIQSGYRPVFILSNDKNNTYSTTVNVIPITAKMNKRLPVHVELWNYNQYGLNSPSTLLVEQITTISSEYLDRCIGKITDAAAISEIKKAISIQFPLVS